MQTQTYFHTKFEIDADRRNDTVPLQVNCVGVMTAKDPFFTKRLRHDFYYVYVLKGRLVMQDCTLAPGDVMIMEPGYAHQYRNEGDTSYLWVHYTGFEAYSLTKSAHLTVNVAHHIGVHKEIIDCFKKLFREFIINDEAAGQLAVCILREILIYTGRYIGADGKNKMPLGSIEYIHQYFKEEIDVDELAEMEHMSCTAFRSAFKRHTGIAPNEYIIQQRMSAACRLLSQTDETISAVAAAVGYRDQYYFSRIFKKKVGMSPQKYRYDKERKL